MCDATNNSCAMLYLHEIGMLPNIFAFGLLVQKIFFFFFLKIILRAGPFFTLGTSFKQT